MFPGAFPTTEQIYDMQVIHLVLDPRAVIYSRICEMEKKEVTEISILVYMFIGFAIPRRRKYEWVSSITQRGLRIALK